MGPSRKGSVSCVHPSQENVLSESTNTGAVVDASGDAQTAAVRCAAEYEAVKAEFERAMGRPVGGTAPRG